MKSILHKNLRRLGYFMFLFIFCLSVLEICFRYQIIDFYQSELNGLNTEKQLASKKDNILIFGDSFTAHPDSYVKYLRKNLIHFNVVNSAIPGTGIKQHELIFDDRIKRYHPRAIIYQFYTGNDFTDIQHPINFKELSFTRNMFWKVSEYFIVLQYINHRLSFLNSKNQSIKKLQKPQFSEELYNRRVKMYYKADKLMLNNTILLSNKKVITIYRKWKEKLLDLRELTGDSIPIYLLIVPHNAQINNAYLEQNKILGADLSTDILNPNYPLIEQVKKDFKNWRIINPLAILQQTGRKNSLYYQNDPHLTIWGQEQLGEIVVNNLNLELE
ncbi:MAG: SGNH/GDSL hydrolase family protein [Flavobacteriales bacterium]|nr:SGNH/GDSL hydrolase family protein [Flavobacteriales bacterium]